MPTQTERTISTKISVCIPTYNGAKYLAEALTSVLNQTFTDFELIVVDDCSTDNTAAMVQSFRDDRLKYVQNPTRLGLVGNWNKCIELSSGQYICIFHQDDVMLPENLAEKIKVLEENPTVGLVYSEVIQINAEGQIVLGWWYFKPEPRPEVVQAGSKFFETLLLGPNIVCCPSVVLRRECFEKLGGFDSRLPYTADWEMWLRVALFYDIAYLVKPLLHYRRHAQNETLKFLGGVAELEQFYQAKTMILDKYPERIPNGQALKAAVAEAYAEQAVERAIQHYRQQQYPETRQYLAFATKTLAAASSYASAEESAYWFLQASEKVWPRLLEQERNSQPTEAEIINRLSGEEIGRRIPIRKIIKAIGFKIAAKLKLTQVATFRRRHPE
jgi:glycosyltransferase involved in cell wall biosynthesis